MDELVKWGALAWLVVLAVSAATSLLAAWIKIARGERLPQWMRDSDQRRGP